MSRKVFDALTSAPVVCVAVVVLLVAGGLLTWGHSFVELQRAQPARPAADLRSRPRRRSRTPRRAPRSRPAMIPSVSQVRRPSSCSPAPRPRPTPTTSSPCTCPRCPTAGSTRRSAAAAIAQPTNAKLGRPEDRPSFTGTTLRGLLLEAYAFSTIGVDHADRGAIASFIAGRADGRARRRWRLARHAARRPRSSSRCRTRRSPPDHQRVTGAGQARPVGAETDPAQTARPRPW